MFSLYTHSNILICLFTDDDYDVVIVVVVDVVVSLFGNF